MLKLVCPVSSAKIITSDQVVNHKLISKEKDFPVKIKGCVPIYITQKSYAYSQKFSSSLSWSRASTIGRNRHNGEFGIKRASDDQSVCLGCWLFQRSGCSFVGPIKLAISDGIEYLLPGGSDSQKQCRIFSE